MVIRDPNSLGPQTEHIIIMGNSFLFGGGWSRRNLFNPGLRSPPVLKAEHLDYNSRNLLLVL